MPAASTAANAGGSTWTKTKRAASPFLLPLFFFSSPSYVDTNWPAILRLYDALLTIQRSPVYLLNRAIVVAQIDGPQAGIRALEEAGQDAALRHYHLFEATLGEFYRRAGALARARQHFEAARQQATSPFDRELIDRLLAQCARR
jgi:RNA polymerase sigma-70 factor (ECF subfamily)